MIHLDTTEIVLNPGTENPPKSIALCQTCLYKLKDCVCLSSIASNFIADSKGGRIVSMSAWMHREKVVVPHA